MEETFSPSQDMTEYVSSGGKLLGNKILVGTWIVIEESGLVLLLRNAYKRE